MHMCITDTLNVRCHQIAFEFCPQLKTQSIQRFRSFEYENGVVRSWLHGSTLSHINHIKWRSIFHRYVLVNRKSKCKSPWTNSIFNSKQWNIVLGSNLKFTVNIWYQLKAISISVIPLNNNIKYIIISISIPFFNYLFNRLLWIRKPWKLQTFREAIIYKYRICK